MMQIHQDLSYLYDKYIYTGKKFSKFFSLDFQLKIMFNIIRWFIMQ